MPVVARSSLPRRTLPEAGEAFGLPFGYFPEPLLAGQEGRAVCRDQVLPCFGMPSRLVQRRGSGKANEIFKYFGGLAVLPRHSIQLCQDIYGDD